jgi:hypothetical protein
MNSYKTTKRQEVFTGSDAGRFLFDFLKSLILDLQSFAQKFPNT